MIEITNDVKETIQNNIEKCITYLTENALEDIKIFVYYGPEYMPGKHAKCLYVTKEQVRCGNYGKHPEDYCNLNEISTDEQMTVLKWWKEIKNGFEEERQRILDSKEVERKLIFEFEV